MQSIIKNNTALKKIYQFDAELPIVLTKKPQSTTFSHYSWNMSIPLTQEIHSQATLNAWLYNLLQGVLHKFIVFWLRRAELLNYKTFRNYSNHVLYIGLAGKLFWY